MDPRGREEREEGKKKKRRRRDDEKERRDDDLNFVREWKILDFEFLFSFEFPTEDKVPSRKFN